MMRNALRFSIDFVFACIAASLLCDGAAQEPATSGQPDELAIALEATEKAYQGIDPKGLREPVARSHSVEVGPPKAFKLHPDLDPKLIQNKFVATLSFVRQEGFFGDATLPAAETVRSAESAKDRYRLAEASIVSTFPRGLVRLVFPQGKSRFVPKHVVNIPGTKIDKTNKYFALLVEHCAPENRPPQSMIDFLTSADADRDVEMNDPYEVDGQVFWTIRVYAPTREETAQRSEAVLKLIDNGLCRSLQHESFAQGSKALELALQSKDQHAKLRAMVLAEEAKAIRLPEIAPDLLRDLKSQKIMTTIELAALDARIRACNELLKEMGDRAQRSASDQFNTVSELKIKAEIDLAGIKEKLDKINGFIEVANQTRALQSQINRMKFECESFYNTVQRHQERAETYARLVSLYAPLDLKDNQIAISPIEWTN